MTDHDPDQDDALKELDRALQVEPSRAFADGVRARVTRSRSQTQRMWWGLAAAASVGLATMTLWRPSVETPTAIADSAVSGAPAQMAATTTPNVTPAHPVTADKAAKPAVVQRAAPVTTVAVAGTTEPRLEVITNQGAVIRELWAAYRGWPLVVADGERVVEGLSTKPIAVDPIVVPPIVVGELGTESGRGGATPIIRRAAATKETR